MIKSVPITDTYFAAANGYDGFRSDFDGVLAPSALCKLYILKGGPGTGKSTLMRKIAEHFSGIASVTKILCSSDIGSLDGVLIEKDGHTVGIADGTAPHVIEPHYPGVIERIVNLGDGFDYRALASHRDAVMSLTEGKKNGYNKAYNALKVAGSIHKYITDVFLDNGIYKTAEILVEGFMKNVTEGESTCSKSPFLLSSFSKDGYKTLPIFSREKEIMRIGTDGISGYALMSAIYKKLVFCKAAIKAYSSPLSPDLIDALETENCVFIIGTFDSVCSDEVRLTVDIDGYSRLKGAYDDMLDEAKRGFAEAAKFHFALEDVYSKNISFDNNNEICEEIISEITEVFDK